MTAQQQQMDKHLRRLADREAAAAAANAALDERLRRKAARHDELMLLRLFSQVNDVLAGTKKQPGNTVRFQGSRTIPICTYTMYAKDGNTQTKDISRSTYHYERFRLKIRMFGYFQLLKKHEVENKVCAYLKKELLPPEGAEIHSVEFSPVKNWWRGGGLSFYDGINEDTFNCIVFLGTPLITRPLAWLYDAWFPRIAVRVVFSKRTVVAEN